MPEPETREYRQFRFSPPPGACEILLVRHGESAAANPDKPFPLVDGQGDPPLHPDGIVQAERVADRLEHQPIAAIYVTPLRRTAETAAPLAARLGVVPAVERDLREVFLGEWEEGRFRKYVSEGHPIALQMAKEQRWDVIPGAEPDEEFAARVRGAILRLAAAHPDEMIVAVSHGGAIGQALAQAVQCRGFAFTGADNGSISHLVVTPDRWILRRYNDTAHLGLGFTSRAQPPT